MSDQDVAAEIEAVIREIPATARYDNEYAVVVTETLLQRARDEILTLRSERDMWRRSCMDDARSAAAWESIRGVRDDALEEAALLCEGKQYFGDAPDPNDIQRNYARRDCADAIRALKDSPH